ncbi:MAG: HEAT repeat domain-containing protein, partial [Planctomycetes bacterium]|nr:HEAT repeat domain-containing protein [Planctomycetota bacterium]
TLALRAIAERAQRVIVDDLLKRLKTERNTVRRAEYVDVLARVWKKPAPWVYWGFLPAPRPVNSVAWERTESIAAALNRALADPDGNVRITALKRMRRENVPLRLESLAGWLRKEKDSQRVAALLDSLAAFPAADVRKLFDAVSRDKSRNTANRLRAFTILMKGFGKSDFEKLLNFARTLEDGPVLAAALRELGLRPKLPGDRLLMSKLGSGHPLVRAAAIRALAARGSVTASKQILRLLEDTDIRVRRAAAAAAGELSVKSAIPSLRKSAGDADRELCRASLQSLQRLGDGAAVPQAVTALEHPVTQLEALDYLQRFGDARQLEPLKKLAFANRAIDVLTGVINAITKWRTKLPKNSPLRRVLMRGIAEIHAASGLLIHWSAVGPLSAEDASILVKQQIGSKQTNGDHAGRTVLGSGIDAVVRLSVKKNENSSAQPTWIAVAHVNLKTAANVEFLAAAGGRLQIWLNGRPVFQRKRSGRYRPNSDRFDAVLRKGANQLLVKLTDATSNPRFHLRFRFKSSQAEHERLVRLALQGRGSVLRGRSVFFNVEKSLCLKCHRFGDKQGRIGPDLTGIGSRFSRIHLIESILEPSRTIAPSYQTLVLALKNGRVLSGVKIAESATTITLGDNQGKTHTIATSDVEERRTQSRSTMPDDLKKRLSDREFVDLITFLLAQKKKQAK